MTKIELRTVVHSKNYCDIAKSTPRGKHACLRCKMLANTKAIRCKEPFGSHCLYGLYEVAVPVISGDNVAAIVYVGNTVIDKAASVERIKKMCKHTSVDESLLIAELEKCEYMDTPEELFRIGELVSDYITWLYNRAPKTKHEMHWLVYLMKRHADEMLRTDMSLSELAKTYQKNEKYIGRLFKRDVGMSYAEYKQERRLRMAESMITDSDERIIDIAFECGFNNVSYFNRAFQRKYGTSPTAYRAKKKKQTVAN